MNRLPYRAILRGAGVVAIGGALVFAPAYFAQESFDPASVQPEACRNNRFRCGYQPTRSEQAAAIPLSDQSYISHRGLPSRVDMSAQMPPVGNQGPQGSCVAWATTYALRSYHEQNERRWGYDAPWTGGQGERVFSPAWTYNQINGGRDEGSVLDNALNLLVQKGAAPWRYMPYDVRDYRRQPSAQARSEAAKYRAKNYRRLNGVDLNAIKAELAAGNPVNFGIPVDDRFYGLKSEVYDTRGGRNYGGHAMTLVGYDDSKRSPQGHVGAFKLINSWGTGWGEQGFGWISYRMWQQLQPYALVLYDNREVSPTPEPEPEVQPQPEPLPGQEEEVERIRPPREFAASKGTFRDRVELSWAPVEGAVAYVLFRASSSTPDNFQQLGYSQTRTYADRAVQAGVAYRYAIVAVASEENYSDPEQSPVAEGYAASTPVVTNTRPGAVLGLEGAAAGRAVQLRWTSTAGAQRYLVARYDANRGQWRQVGQAAQTSYTDAAPQANAENFYVVRAVGAGGAGPWSDPISVNVAGQTTPPAAPEGLVATEAAFADRIEVKWTAVAGASKYYVYRYNYSSEEWQGPNETNAPRFTDSSPDVRSGEWFGYTVVAANAAGHSDYADPVAGRAKSANERAGTQLPPPAELRADLQTAQRRVNLRWSAVAGAEEYYVLRRKRGDSAYVFVVNVPGNRTTYSESIPEAGELYFYVVRSKHALGAESANSNAAVAFVNVEREAPRERALPGFGFDKFEGQWRGEYWDGEGPPVEVFLELKGQGEQYSGEFRYGNQPTRRFQGGFASGASTVESASGLRFNLLGQESGDLANVQLLSGSLSQNEREFTVTRTR